MALATAWLQGKDALVLATGWPRDGLHLAIGLLLFLLAAACTRARTRSLKAWLAVLAIAVANELLDLVNDMHLSGGLRLGESWHDITTTMLLPTSTYLWSHTLHAAVRYRRNPLRHAIYV